MAASHIVWAPKAMCRGTLFNKPRGKNCCCLLSTQNPCPAVLHAQKKMYKKNYAENSVEFTEPLDVSNILKNLRNRRQLPRRGETRDVFFLSFAIYTGKVNTPRIVFVKEHMWSTA